MDSASLQGKSTSAGWTRSVAAVGCLLLLVAGLGTNLCASWTHKLDLFPGTVTWPAFLDGKVTVGMAHALSGAPLPAMAARWQRGLAWDAFGDLGPRVRVGCDGWLFLADELRVHPQGDADMRVRAEVLAQVRDVLAKRDIHLLVVTVPDKSRIESAWLCGISRPSVFAGRMQSWDNLLVAAGIDHVDVQAAFHVAQQHGAVPLFLKADTHWNESGARIAADATATAVLAKLTPAPHQQWRVTTGAPQLRPGDLVHLAGLGKEPSWRPLPADHVPVSTIEPLPESSEGSAPDANALFGNTQEPNVALIGTSYSNTSNFALFLEDRLQARIGRFARDGGDFDGAARDYFTSAAFKQAPPRVLVWEIPERVLQLPAAEASRDLPNLLQPVAAAASR